MPIRLRGFCCEFDGFRFQKKRWSWSAGIGLVIPPLAFVGWTMAQKSTAFDALSSGTSQATRETVVIIGALALSLLATGVSYTANKAPAKS